MTQITGTLRGKVLQLFVKTLSSSAASFAAADSFDACQLEAPTYAAADDDRPDFRCCAFCRKKERWA